jgi:hypothetical protein
LFNEVNTIFQKKTESEIDLRPNEKPTILTLAILPRLVQINRFGKKRQGLSKKVQDVEE